MSAPEVTTTMLSSFVAGEWYSAPSGGKPAYDAATGEEVCRVSSEGVDMAKVVAHGRETAGPALRKMTFHERAAILKALGLYLKDQRAELYALSTRTGATLGDSKFDVDGGIGVLRSYASKARRELPNMPYYVDGDVEQLGTTGAFLGQHICTPRLGVAVQINAFNFPVWGPLEKLAPAFLAGMPSVVKPASQTAYLTAKLVELIVDSELLPEGSLQLICGGVGDLFEHLTEQDLVAFTGSAATAQKLRTHPSVAARSVPFNAEADSLNCSILGSDAAPGTPLFDLFVNELVIEMTVKAGQKCTAIRRAIVPSAFVDELVSVVRQRLADVTVGDPSRDDVNMGPLASAEQRDEFRRGVRALEGAGELVYGNPDHVDALDADAERGAFISPILALCDDAGRPEPHEVEAFGPVSTILPYDTLSDAIEMAARGRGSLVGSVVTGDRNTAREVVLGLAPWHGRLLVLNERSAAESTGHGSPLPPLVHGGPGRAGGGEEMGGIRGVLHHMQRSAVQGDPDVITAVTERWIAGAATDETDVHPFRKYLEELRIGDTIVTAPRTVTQEDVEHFAEFTGDTFYAHMDAEAAAANPFFGERVAHGYLVLSFAAGLFVDPDPGPVLANFGLDNLRFLAPTKFGDTIRVRLTVKQLTPRAGADYGEVRWDAQVMRDDGEAVARYDLLTLVAKRPADG